MMNNDNDRQRRSRFDQKLDDFRVSERDLKDEVMELKRDRAFREEPRAAFGRGGGGRHNGGDINQRKRSRFDDDGSGPSSSVGAFQAASAALSSSGHRVGGGFKSVSSGFGQTSIGLESAWGGPNKKYEKKIMEIMGPSRNLPQLDVTEKKFGASNKLWIGNILSSTTEQDIRDLCRPYGDVDDIFVNKEKKFAFVKFDYKVNAEKFKINEDGREIVEGKFLRISFSSSMNAIKVKNVNPCVTNELLFKAFSTFGQVETAKVIPNSNNYSGNKLCEGIVVFSNQSYAKEAVAVCNEYPFVLTASIIPVIVEPYEEADNEEGRSERTIAKDENYITERDIGPRFIKPGTFDFNFCDKYKQLTELRRQKNMALEKEMELEEEKLCAQMEVARYDHETQMFKTMFEKREQERVMRLEMITQRQLDVDRRLEMEQEKRRMRESMFDFNVSGVGQSGDMRISGDREYMGQQQGQEFAQRQEFPMERGDFDQNRVSNPMMGTIWDQAKHAIQNAQDMGHPHGEVRGLQSDLINNLNMLRANLMGDSGPPMANDIPDSVWNEFNNGEGKRPRYPGEVLSNKPFGRGGKR